MEDSTLKFEQLQEVEVNTYKTKPDSKNLDYMGNHQYIQIKGLQGHRSRRKISMPIYKEHSKYTVTNV